MKKPTLSELAARVRLLEEQVVSLTELLVVDHPPEDEAPASLEAQHQAFAGRLKEKRR